MNGIGSHDAVDLVFCSATDREHPFLEKLEAARHAGFNGISITLGDYRRARASGLSDSDLAAEVKNAGLFVAEVSAASTWLDGSPDEDERLGLHVLNVLDARGLNCNTLKGRFRSVTQATEAFQAICDRAARRGGRCHVEFVPWTEPRNLTAAWEVVKRAERPNGGLMLDSWHLYRSGGTPEDVRIVDPEKIFAIQIADAPLSPRHPDRIVLTFDRLLPGAGSADIAGLLRVLRQIGVVEPYGAEVPSPMWSGHSAVSIATAVHAALASVIKEAWDDPHEPSVDPVPKEI